MQQIVRLEEFGYFGFLKTKLLKLTVPGLKQYAQVSIVLSQPRIKCFLRKIKIYCIHDIRLTTKHVIAGCKHLTEADSVRKGQLLSSKCVQP